MNVVILQGVPGWGFCEDPGLALQTVGDGAREVCLERDGQRVFEPVSTVPARVLRSLWTGVHSRRTSIEAQWVSYMISKGR